MIYSPLPGPNGGCCRYGNNIVGHASVRQSIASPAGIAALIHTVFGASIVGVSPGGGGGGTPTPPPGLITIPLTVVPPPPTVTPTVVPPPTRMPTHNPTKLPTIHPTIPRTAGLGGWVIVGASAKYTLELCTAKYCTREFGDAKGSVAWKANIRPGDNLEWYQTNNYGWQYDCDGCGDYRHGGYKTKLSVVGPAFGWDPTTNDVWLRFGSDDGEPCEETGHLPDNPTLGQIYTLTVDCSDITPCEGEEECGHCCSPYDENYEECIREGGEPCEYDYGEVTETYHATVHFKYYGYSTQYPTQNNGGNGEGEDPGGNLGSEDDSGDDDED